MKRLLLARHAKSSWDDPDLRDIDRPLNQRGLRAAPVIGQALVEKNYLPDAIFASPAQRTRTTAQLLATELNFPHDQIQIIDSFYGASQGEIVHHTRQLPDTIDTALLVGHNPTWTLLSHRLTNHRLDNLPTAGILVIDFPINTWPDLNTGNHTDLLIPRQYGV